MNNLTPRSIAHRIIHTSTRLELLSERFIFALLGLTAPAIKILGLLYKEEVMQPSELMESLNCTKSNISQRLQLLEKKNLVRKTAGFSDDRRTVTVALTADGRRKFREILAFFRKSTPRIDRNFSAREKGDFFAFIDKLNDILDGFEKKLSTSKARKL